MSVTSKELGCSRDGMSADVTNLGAILVRLFVPDAEGRAEDVVLGFDKAEDYYGNPSFFGATIGPNANRIGNAEYEIDGIHYELDINDTRRHHEIYLSDARKVAPEKLRTVIRHPIRRKE